MILFKMFGLHATVFTNYDRVADDIFEKQLNGMKVIVEKNMGGIIWNSLNIILLVLAGFICAILSQWVLATMLFTGALSDVIFIAVAHIFIEKHKDRAERISPKILLKKETVKKDDKELNPIIQRLKSIG